MMGAMETLYARLGALGRATETTLKIEWDGNMYRISAGYKPLAYARHIEEAEAYINGLRDMYLLMKYGNVPE